jgi:peptide-methionine (S)-S-oxide reductase
MLNQRLSSKRRVAGFAVLSVVLVGLAGLELARADAIDKVVQAPQIDEAKTMAANETAVFAGGCFWGMQGVFEHVKGVERVVAGYAGGARETASYDQVTTETTGHAESIQVMFDPKLVSYGTLLRIYFSVAHDPTELNRQGPDEGSSYRSEIFFAGPEQQRIASAYITQLNRTHVFATPIVTRVEPLKGFYVAEAYHQDFLIKNPQHPYIVVNDLPKIDALKRLFPQIYREIPANLASARP